MNRVISFVNGFLRLIRVNNLIILFFTQYFTAIFLFNPAGRTIPLSKDLSLLLLSLSTLLIAAAGYMINDYHDVKIDAINKPGRILVGRVLQRRQLLFVYVVLNFVAVIMGTSVSLRVAAIHVLSISLLWVYSAHFKKTPFWGNLLIAGLTSLSIFIVAVYYRQNYLMVGLYASLAFFVSLIREIVKDMEDIKGDAAFGARTLPITMGLRGAKRVIYLIAFVFLVVLYLFDIYIDLWRFIVISIVIGVEVLILIYLIYRADTKDKFHFCSNFCKAILLSGVISMIWVN